MYEEVWTEWEKVNDIRRGRLYDYHGREVEGKIDVLEKLLNRHVDKQYLRAGEPIRAGIRDIIEYHNKLDRQYGIQIAERQEQ